MCTYHMCVSHICTYADSRAQEGQRRVPDPLTARGRTATRLRALEAHRVEVARRAHLPRRLALSVALPHGSARMDHREMGREGRTTAAPLLLDHPRRPKNSRCAAAELAGVCRSDREHLRGPLCLTGARRFARGSAD